jgi:hypothetical protein
MGRAHFIPRVRVAAIVGSLILLASCDESTGPRIPSDLSGVWMAVLAYIGPADTLALLVPDRPDSFAMAIRRPGNTGFVGPIHRAGQRLTGTLAYPFGPGGFTIDLTLQDGRLSGTLDRNIPIDTAKRVDFVRYVPSGPDLGGTWVTNSVIGAAPDVVYLDTLLMRSDGRARLTSTFTEDGLPPCPASTTGYYTRSQNWVILTYLPLPPGPTCAQIRQVDSLQVQGSNLTRVRHFITGDVVETLTKR